MNILTYILIKLIKSYKFLVSPLLGNTCRYFPSCSEYAIEALNEFGLVKGLIISFKRILSCHPIKILGGGSSYNYTPNKEHIKKDKFNG